MNTGLIAIFLNSSGHHCRCDRNQKMCGISDRRITSGGDIYVWKGFSAAMVYTDPGCAC